MRISEGYHPKLDLRATERAIKFIKDDFEQRLAEALNLERISAPLFVLPETGLNDELNAVERPVAFEVKALHKEAEIVHSLAKWKRMALYRYGFEQGTGLYTDMNAIRRDEDMDPLHSIYVDQWDWEKVISREERNLDTLKNAVTAIINALGATLRSLKERFPSVSYPLSEDVFFVTAQELLDMYPTLPPKARENTVCEKYGTVCLMQIGDILSNGEPHDGRAPDYDDWGLNCDILVWSGVLGQAVELSSMGIRVDAETLRAQLKKRGKEHYSTRLFHSMLLEDKLPLTIGGGIGQSRLCMILLEKAHIGEVHASVWDEKTLTECDGAGLELL